MRRWRHLIFLMLLCYCPPVAAQAMLVTRTDSTRAISLDSVNQLGEPYKPVSSYGQTRISLFALDLPTSDPSSVTCEAEDASHKSYQFKVEYVGRVPGLDWLTQVSVIVPDDIGDAGDVLLSITYQGARSNRARVGIGHTGGGLPDDGVRVQLSPPPYTLKGRVLSNGAGLANVSLALSGAQTGVLLTDADGNYSFTISQLGSIALTASKPFYVLTPPSRSFNPIYGDRVLNFEAVPVTYNLTGQVRDDRGAPLSGVSLTLSGSKDAVTTSDENGGFSFGGLWAGGRYTISPAKTDYIFSTQTFDTLSGNLATNVSGTPVSYKVGGRFTDEYGTGVKGVKVSLSNGTATTTDENGAYSLTARAQSDYTLSASSPFYAFPAVVINRLHGDQAINISGTLRHYRITGKVAEGEQTLTNISLTLEEVHGLFTMPTYIDSNGRYSIDNVPAGFTYGLRAIDTEIYGFQSKLIETLDSDKTIDFSAVRFNYLVQGVVADRSGAPLSGATIMLTGYRNQTLQTDAQGRYSLSLPAGFGYELSIAKSEYIFSPQTFSVPYLYFSQQGNFTAIKTYQISGRVTENGVGLPAIPMQLAGAESQQTTTGIDGSYSFIVTTLGNYNLRPAEDYYNFTPSIQSFTLTAGTTLNFTGSFAPLPSPSYVLEFDGTPATADYHYFWPEFTDLGHFYWEFWASPGENNYTRYLISDGYGGAHALLFGFDAGESGRYNLTGNIWSTTGATNFFSDEGPVPFEWGHFAVGWDGRFITTYYDGVPVGRQAFSGPRLTLGPNSGASWLFIGGSNHQNLIGRIAQVRGFEDSNPRESAPQSSFTPQTLFGREGSFLSYYFRPSNELSDLSLSGYRGVSHPGQLRGVLYGYMNPCPDCPLPKYVIDSTAPNFSNPTPIQTKASASRPPPSGALIFDSFQRSNSTYILNGAGGLGAVELGNQTWQYSPGGVRQPFGILSGRGVILADERAVAWVDAGTSDASISVDRLNGGSGAGVDTGLAFRVADASNYFFAYTSGGKLFLGYYSQGARHDIASVIAAGNWKTLRVVTKADGTIEVYANDLIYSGTNMTLSSATGAGLYNNEAGLGLANRWDNFTVLPVAP
jgi:hypothetical protein